MPPVAIPESDVDEIARRMILDGKFIHAMAFGGDHINETYCVTFIPVRKSGPGLL